MPTNRDLLPYRDNAGVVLFNAAGQVLIGQRKAGAKGGLAHAWQFPQGGIDEGEEPVAAALRELYEETSVRSISILATTPDWIYYDLPDALLGHALGGKYRGQRQKWVAALFEGDEAEIDVLHPGGGTHPAEFAAWRWIELGAVIDLVVPFKRKAYGEVLAAFAEVPARLREKRGDVA